MTLDANRLSSLKEPHARVRWQFIALYALAYTGIWLALLTPVVVTIALRVSALGSTAPAQDLALILSAGATCAMIAAPIFGFLSDRTTSRFGMRRPWIVGGMLSGCIALLAVALSPTVLALLISWCIAQLAFNAALAGVFALLADQIPKEQRGVVAGIMGVCMPLGQLLGTYIVHVTGDSLVLAFMIPGVLGTGAVIALAVVLNDRRMPVEQLSTASPAKVFRIDIAAHRDFWCVWLSRLILGIGIAFLTTYQPLYLVETLHRPLSEVPQLMFRSMLLQSTLVIAASLAFGKLSDRWRRRKSFVVIGALIYAVGLWWIAQADSYTVFLVGLAITSIAHGMYFSVDLALVTEVLPNAEQDAAKDLGILNVTNTLPQIVAPILGAAILGLADGSYAAMYGVASLVALLGALTLLPVKAR